MSCPIRTYPFTKDKAAAVCAELQKAGMTLDPSSTSGQIQGPHGVLLGYTVDGTKATITVSVLHKPIVVPCDAIFNVLDQNLGTPVSA